VANAELESGVDLNQPPEARGITATGGTASSARRIDGWGAALDAPTIDKQGVIQYAEATPTPKDLPNFEAVKAKLGELG
jgi:hypothetical protein